MSSSTCAHGRHWIIQAFSNVSFVFLQFKAAIRTFNPREEKYMQPEPKFKISVSSSIVDK